MASSGTRRLVGLLLILSFFPLGLALAQTQTASPVGASPMVQMGTGETSLWQMIKYGGWTMAFLGLLSIFGTFLVLYQMLTLQANKLLQPGMVRKVYALLNQGKINEAYEHCRRRTGPVAAVLATGLRRVGQDLRSITEAMETAGNREAEILRTRNRLLGDIGTLSPMFGLLGTVIGLIGAFNAITFDVSTVKPIMLASQVSKALVTTAAGLVVGIPAMGFYFYFRGVLLKNLAAIEVLCLEFAERCASMEPEDNKD